MSFKQTYFQFFESATVKFGQPLPGGRFANLEDCMAPGRDGFIEGSLPKIWGPELDSPYDSIHGISKEKSFVANRYNLKSIKNSPEIVKGTIYLSHNLLQSLEGGPKRVTGHYACSANPNLESLEGFPDFVGGDFSARSCPKLTPLEFARVDAGNKVVGEISWGTGDRETNKTLDKEKCTRAYYDLMTKTDTGEQHELGEI